MSKTAPVRWRLYVDEAGDFEEPDDDVVVAGLLTPAAAATEPAEVARRLRDAAPLPWPLHAAHLHRPSWWLLSVLAEAPQVERNYPDIVRRATRALRTLDNQHALAAAIEGVRAGRRVPIGTVLLPLDRAFKNADPALYAVLQDTIAAAQRAVWQVVAEVFGPGGKALVCGESRRGAAYDGELEYSRRGSVRYDTLLRALFDRLAGALRAAGGRHEVRLQVLSRPTVDRVLGRKVALHVRHVSELVREAVSPHDHNVRLIVDDVPAFDDLAHPALVVADFIANRVRWLLGPTLTLERVEARIQQGTRLGTRLGPGQPSLVTTAGACGQGPFVRWATGQMVPEVRS